MLKVENIHKSFGVKVLDGVSLEAPCGQLTILEGANGAGKSTLFNILAGSLTPDEGHIRLGNEDITEQDQLLRAAYMAILVQDVKAAVAPSLTLLENGALALLKNRSATLRSALNVEARKTILAHLSRLEIPHAHLLETKMGELSGGQRQILAFAFATILKPRLLLLDEPTAALDEQSGIMLMQLIKKFTLLWDIPAVMISHNTELNRSYGDHIVFLSAGRIVNKHQSQI
jgi:putative ABC transport system ATP-binding protein